MHGAAARSSACLLLIWTTSDLEGAKRVLFGGDGAEFTEKGAVDRGEALGEVASRCDRGHIAIMWSCAQMVRVIS